MQTIRVVLDENLLAATDRAAQACQLNRSALVREALHAFLRQLRIRELEDRDRRGYEEHPERAGELDAWEQAAAWPEESWPET
jgi:metal-responsive CopG/Arc/MetJ family transcriptional regulator